MDEVIKPIPRHSDWQNEYIMEHEPKKAKAAKRKSRIKDQSHAQ